MNKQREKKNPERAFLIAGILDDQRWEKLASGNATPEEIAALRAWATQSKAAKAVWDIFRPATGEEVDALTANVFRRLNPQKALRPDNRIPRLDRPKDDSRSSSGRMMARHLPRQRDNREPPAACVDQEQRFRGNSHLVVNEKGDKRRSCRSLYAMSELPNDFRQTASSKQPPISRPQMDAGLPVRPDPSVTTTSRMALSREAAAPSVVEASTIATKPREPDMAAKGDRDKRKGIFSHVAAALLLVTLFAMSGAIFESKHQNQAAEDIAASAWAGPVFERKFYATLEAPLADQSLAITDGPPKPTVGADSASSASSAENPFASGAATAPASPVVRRSLPVKKMVESCVGLGVFRRCMKVAAPPAPTLPERQNPQVKKRLFN